MGTAATQLEGKIVPKITLYVRDAYADVWDRARKLTDDSDDSLSSFVSDALKDAVERKEEEQQAESALADRMEPVELELYGRRNQDHSQTVRFTGVLLAQDEREIYSIYQTKGGKFVLHVDTPLDGSSHSVYDSLEELQEADEKLDQGLLADAFEAVGRPFIIDID